MKRILLLLILIFASCTKEEYIPDVPTPTPSTPFQIYNTSFEIHELNSGYYSYHTTNTLDNPLLVVGLTYVDFNRDGYVDILGKDENNPNVLKLYTNNGNDFYTPSIIQIQGGNTIPSGTRKIITSDINNDGDLDIIYALAPDDETSERGLFVLENSNNIFIKHTLLNGERDWIHSVTAGDINNDGNIDIFAGGKGYIFMGNGDFTFSKKDLPNTMVHYDFVNDDYNTMGISQEMIDINGDGYVDILMGYHLNNVDYIGQDYANSHVIHYGTGDDTMFTEPYVLQSFYMDTNITLDFSTIDFDNDGDLDLFVNSNFNYGGRGYVIQYYENNGYMNFVNKTNEVFENESNLAEGYYAIDFIKFIDMDDDGIKELMVEGVNWYRGSGNEWIEPTWNGFTLNENNKFIRKKY